MTRLKNPVQMATVGAAQGIKGEVRVKTFTGDPLALGAYRVLHGADGRTFEIVDIREHKGMAVVRFKGVGDRTAAEALTGTALYVERGNLPDDLEEEEFYHTDLIGMDAVSLDGEALGKVTAVQNFGGGDILEIERSTRSTVLIPFSRAAVPVVDVAMRTIRIDPIAAGLVDDEDDEAPQEMSERPRGPKEAGGNR
ncbi:MAG: ribosome maturation factor RimM [Mesorhizobium sp.]